MVLPMALPPPCGIGVEGATHTFSASARARTRGINL